jgi:hypothetical protein
MKTKTRRTRKKSVSRSYRKKSTNHNKAAESHALGGANFFFSTEEINAIKQAVKNSAMVEAESLAEIDMIKTPALIRHLENDVRVLESILDKLNFSE